MLRLHHMAFRLVQKIPFLRYHLLQNLPVKIAGVRLKIPVIEGQYPQFKGYEDWLVDVIGGIFERKAGAFIDVGTNRGQTLIKVAAIDSQRAYIGFEPNIACAYFVEQIISLNRLGRHSIFAMGLADAFSPVRLLLSNTGSESNTTAAGVRGGAAYGATKYVLVQSGDAVVSAMQPESVALIKIDVEGAELAAVDLIIIEYPDQPRNQRGRSRAGQALKIFLVDHADVGIEARQPHRRTGAINKCCCPAHFAHRLQRPCVHHQRRRSTKRDHVGQAIELGTEFTLRAGHARDASIEAIENHCAKNRDACDLELAIHPLND